MITESSENTTSIKAICTSTAAKPAAAWPPALGSSTSSELWTSRVALAMRKAPPTKRITSRPEMSWPSTVRKSPVRLITQDSDSNRPMRMTMASARPTTRARCCWCFGSRLVSTLMKMMLSMPSTISNAAKVAKAIQMPGSISMSSTATLLPNA